jgi:hypothetical protein
VGFLECLGPGARVSRRARRTFLVGVLAVGAAAIGVVSLFDGPPVSGAPAPIPAPPPSERVRVEVLNGGGVTGMARDATSVLRDRGFDVVDFGNAAAFDPERPTVVIDRVGRPEWARSVADALGIENVLSEPDPNHNVDVSVLLGSEWSRPAGWGGDEERRMRARWDPRAWLSR